MSSHNTKSPSEFVEAALGLDAIFTSLEHLAQELARLSIDSDKGMKRALLLLDQFAKHSQQLEAGIRNLSQALVKAQNRTAMAAQKISESALAVQERKREIERMQDKYKALGDMVRQVTVAMEKTKKPAGDELTAEEEAQLGSTMMEFYGHLGKLIDEASKFKEEAINANMKALASNADSLRQTLQAAQLRLNLLVERYHGSQSSQTFH